MNPDDFKLYHVADFPIVRIRGSLLPHGYAPQWIMEMEALLAHGEPFVFVFLDSAEHPAHEDQKAQTMWLKAHKKPLALCCRGFVSVEPEHSKRVLKRAQAVVIAAAFGLHFSVVPDPQQAEVRARQLLAGLDVTDADA
ncbi:hypothetical protein AAFF27_10550 [Xylophilus sp. GW821-FHT01B05]